MVDVAHERALAPGVAEAVGFDHAGGGPPPEPVTLAMRRWADHEARVGVGAAARSADADGFYHDAARFIGASPEEIAFVEGAAKGWQAVLLSFQWRPGDRVLTCRSRGASESIALIRASQRHQVSVEAIPGGSDGRVSLAALEAMLDGHVRLVAVTLAAAHRGVLESIDSISRLTRAHGVPLLVDASYALGQVPVRVDTLGCDFLVASGARFLRGPAGSGLLFVRRSELGRLDWPVVDARGAAWVTADGYIVRKDARRLESSERALGAVVGMRAAILHAEAIGIEAIGLHLQATADRLRERLASIPGVRTWDATAPNGAIVSFTVAGRAAATVRDALASAGVTVAAIGPSEARLDLIPRGLTDGVIRASVHVTTTDAEIEALARAVAAL